MDLDLREFKFSYYQKSQGSIKCQSTMFNHPLHPQQRLSNDQHQLS
jgi:hypothetical protein